MPNSGKNKPLTPNTNSGPVTRSGSITTPTNNDLMQAILGIQTTQSLQFGELRGCLSSLSDQITELKNENSVLRTEVFTLTNRVLQLEANPVSSFNADLSTMILRELSERNFCDLNVIAYDIPESSSPSSSQRITDDSTELSNALSPTNVVLPSNVKLIRLGGNAARKPRPLKIICRSKEDAVELVAKFRRAITSGCNIRDGIRIVRDKTSLERELLRKTHAELERRKQSGEPNLIISYVKGVPSVTTNYPKNVNAGRH
jgi:hypothetical protein